MTRRVAIYEPVPRICGPGTWTDNLRWGLRELGHRCDVVTFNRSGKRAVSWGRVLRDSAASASCTLVPDRVEKLEHAGRTLDEYDLVILPDVRNAVQDKLSYNRGDPWPEYVDVLRQTRTPFSSALHFKLYYQEHEAPPRCAAFRGCPFVDELLRLRNFTGCLLTGSADWARNCKRLQDPVIRWCTLPLPYRLSLDDETLDKVMGFKARCDLVITTLGRIDFLKFRQLVHQVLADDRESERFGLVTYQTGGACPVARGPSDARQYYEHLLDLGFASLDESTDWKGGVKRAVPFTVTKENRHVEYVGAYEDPVELAGPAKVHVGISAEYVSGGIFEYAALEAIDHGCVPVVTPAYDPGYCVRATTLHSKFVPFSTQRTRGLPREQLLDVRDAMYSAYQAWSPEAVRQNREEIRRRHDPRLHARAFMEGAGL